MSHHPVPPALKAAILLCGGLLAQQGAQAQEPARQTLLVNVLGLQSDAGQVIGQDA